jgi:hypothetical protein
MDKRIFKNSLILPIVSCYNGLLLLYWWSKIKPREQEMKIFFACGRPRGSPLLAGFRKRRVRCANAKSPLMAEATIIYHVKLCPTFV